MNFCLRASKKRGKALFLKKRGAQRDLRAESVIAPRRRIPYGERKRGRIKGTIKNQPPTYCRGLSSEWAPRSTCSVQKVLSKSIYRKPNIPLCLWSVPNIKGHFKVVTIDQGFCVRLLAKGEKSITKASVVNGRKGS